MKYHLTKAKKNIRNIKIINFYFCVKNINKIIKNYKTRVKNKIYNKFYSTFIIKKLRKQKKKNNNNTAPNASFGAVNSNATNSCVTVAGRYPCPANWCWVGGPTQHICSFPKWHGLEKP